MYFLWLFFFLGLLGDPQGNSEIVWDTVTNFPEKNGRHHGLPSSQFVQQQRRLPKLLGAWEQELDHTHTDYRYKILSGRPYVDLCWRFWKCILGCIFGFRRALYFCTGTAYIWCNTSCVAGGPIKAKWMPSSCLSLTQDVDADDKLLS